MNSARKQGFTLVELLVVMAIIAILASIVVPNVIGYIRSSRETKAYAEVKNIDLALSKMLADANRHSLLEFFDPQIVSNVANGDFTVELNIYSRTIYALMRQGRLTLNDTDPEIGDFNQYLRPAVVQKLGLQYMDVAFDPWDQLYNIYPGPWSNVARRDNNGLLDPAGEVRPTPFRVYLQPDPDSKLPGTQGGAKNDVLTVSVQDLATNEPAFTVGYSASPEKTFYIWSNGENTLNDQAMRSVSGTTGKQAYTNPDEIFFGGGDDINNWDNERSWARFYN